MSASFSRRFQTLSVVLGAILLVVSGCNTSTPSSAQPSGGGAVAASDITIYFVGCAAPTGFHAYLARGADDASKNLGVKVVYVYPDKLTLPNQIEKMNEAIAAKANGIIVCIIADDAGYKEGIDNAKAAGVALGTADGPPLGYGPTRHLDDPWLFHVGSDEHTAGEITAQRLLAMGVKGRVFVGDQQPGDAPCRARADGEIEVLKAAGVEAEFVEMPMDPGQQTETLTTYLRAHPDTVAATSICDVIDGFLAAKEQSGKKDLILTGYDVVSQSLAAIKDGRQAFTIDQQQYWRGYMPIVLMTHYLKYGLQMANPFLTGPSVVDKDNVAQVEKLVTAGFR